MSGKGLVVRVACGVALLAAGAVGQRAPCTGCVLDAKGRPLDSARVTFCQEATQMLGQETDRVEVTTKADGTFSAPLLLGSPYVVWAIGRPEANGERLLTGVSMQAAAGKDIGLTAEHRGLPRRIELQGVAGWIAKDPPSLRVLIGGQHALAADVLLPGDGALLLGPWPDREALLALVDAKGQTLTYPQEVLEDTTSVSFLPPHEIECEVTDVRGTALAGVELAVHIAGPSWWHTSRDPLPRSYMQRPRIAARTDPAGRAKVRVPWPAEQQARYFMIVATHSGFGASLCGYMGGRFCNSKPAPEEGPMTFVLPEAGRRTWQLRGLLPGEQPIAMLAAFHQFTTGKSLGAGDLLVTAPVKNGVATGLTPATSTVARGYVRLLPHGDEPPRRVVTQLLGQGAEMPALDFATLRATTVLVVYDNGAPAPFAHVAITSREKASSLRWHDRCVADEAGRVRLLDTQDDWVIVATDEWRLGCATLDASAKGSEFRLVLEPMPIADLWLSDSEGERVQGARISYPPLPQTRFRGGDEITAAVRNECAQAMLWAARSDRRGLMRVPLPAGEVSVVIRKGELRSKGQTLRAGGADVFLR